MSAVKFKIAFTINAETLFTLASKLLPIEDLSIEEVVERQPQLNDGPRFDAHFDLPKPMPKAKKLKRKYKREAK